MKLHHVPAFAFALALFVDSSAAQDKPDLTNPNQRASYALGVNIASSLKRQEMDLDAKALAAGITDTLSGKPALTTDQMKEALEGLQKRMMEKAQAEAQKYGDGDKNMKEGDVFLAANAKKEGVKVTSSGLQYKVLKTGSGESPKAVDKVKVHYHGTLIDGTVFDSSVERGEPIEFPLDGVIPGWTEGVQLMKVGDKFQFVIPSKLAYGAQGAGSKIGPNATLVFEVELLGITKKN
jgi:FKBP-type peptidyl-prolyl cis-trans isomerase FklB